jgi:hypothetical protein
MVRMSNWSSRCMFDFLKHFRFYHVSAKTGEVWFFLAKNHKGICHSIYTEGENAPVVRASIIPFGLLSYPFA